MPVRGFSVSELARPGSRGLLLGLLAIVAILALAAGFLLWSLPSADAFNARVERLFVENQELTAPEQVKLLEILAQSGTAFADVLASYRRIIFILMLFATGLLVAGLVFLALIAVLSRRLDEVARQGIRVASLVISRDRNAVSLNDLEFTLTPAAIETLSALAEARMDDEVLTGAALEAVISGRRPEDCEEAAGATRIKRLRDALGNQMVSALLVKTIARKGYALAIEREAIRML